MRNLCGDKDENLYFGLWDLRQNSIKNTNNSVQETIAETQEMSRYHCLWTSFLHKCISKLV